MLSVKLAEGNSLEEKYIYVQVVRCECTLKISCEHHNRIESV